MHYILNTFKGIFCMLSHDSWYFHPLSKLRKFQLWRAHTERNLPQPCRCQAAIVMPIHGTVWTRALSTIESHSDAKVHSLVQQRPKHRRNLGFGLHDPSGTKIIPSEFRPKLRQICPPQLIQSVWPGVWLHSVLWKTKSASWWVWPFRPTGLAIQKVAIQKICIPNQFLI